MINRLKILLIVLFFGFSLSLFAGPPKGLNNSKKDKYQNRIMKNDLYEFIAVNQCRMWMSNNGDGSYNPISAGSGFYWPGGPLATISAIFEDGLIYGGKVNGEIRVGGSTYRHGWQAGKIKDDGTATDPEAPEYKIYKVRRDWETFDPTLDYDDNGTPDFEEYRDDFYNWPVKDGAPWVDVNGNGIYDPDQDNPSAGDHPEWVGDEVLWYVANDLDASRTLFLYGTQPIGLEFQVTAFAFNRTGDLGDIVFKKYLVINKGTNTVDSMFIAYWSDTDLGDANDDFSGSDTTLSLGYTYNGDNDDASYYGVNPPAIGYDFFQGPMVKGKPGDAAKFLGKFREGYKNLPMTGYSFYINGSTTYSDPELGTAAGAEQMYFYLKSRLWNGDPFIDPHTGNPVKFCLAGDPVAGTGWYEGAGWPGGEKPGDRRHLMSSGPFVMEPGDTQEVVVGIIIGRSSSNIKSVKELKIKDQAAQFAYDADFNIPPSPPAPNTHAFEGDGFVNLWWEDNAESYDNRFYKFEGYRIFQFRNSAQSLSSGEMLDIFDIKNNISVIEDFVKVNGERIIAPVILANNSGIFRSYKLTTDSYTNGPLVNANPYYFAVTAYAVAKSADITPAFLESPPKILEVMPGRRDADDNLSVSLGENLMAKHPVGLGDAQVQFRVVDPRSLLDADYSMTFDTVVVVDSTGETSLAYTVVKTVGSTEDTIITNSTDFSPDEENKKINDGLMIIVDNYGVDSLAAVPPAYRVRDIIEVVNSQGVTMDPPVNVLFDIDSNATAADGNWYIKSSTGDGFVWQKTATKQGLKYDYYEIRFTGTSQFYTAAKLFSDKPTKNDDLGVGTLPFEIWDIGRNLDDPSDDQRLIIKVLDKTLNETEFVQDSQWTKLSNGDWEQLYAYYDPDLDPANLDPKSGRSKDIDHKFGRFVFHGDLPAAGSGVVIRIRTYQGLSKDDKFVFNGKSQNFSDPVVAKENLDKITVFPNPYFGSNDLETSKYLRFVRFTGLPKHTIIRIFSLSGVYIVKLEKDDTSQYLDWNLLNKDALPVASGMYIAHIDMPGIGTKILKIAVILEQQYIDRL